MTRGAHAFNAVENRIDRGKTRERRQAQDILCAETARATANGVLGAFNDDRQPDVALAHGEEFFRRYAALTDGAIAASALSKLAGVLCASIEGPRDTAKRRAEAAFQGGDA